MKKQEVAELIVGVNRLAQVNENSDDKLVTIIEAAVSALATSDPILALSVIRQLNKRMKDIEELLANNEMEDAEATAAIKANLPNMFSDEDDGGQYDN